MCSKEVIQTIGSLNGNRISESLVTSVNVPCHVPGGNTEARANYSWQKEMMMICVAPSENITQDRSYSKELTI